MARRTGRRGGGCSYGEGVGEDYNMGQGYSSLELGPRLGLSLGPGLGLGLETGLRIGMGLGVITYKISGLGLA